MSRFVVCRLLGCLGLLTVSSGWLAAQQTTQLPQQANPTKPGEPDASQPIRVSVENVVAPVLVFNREGGIVSGLKPDQFRLFDNGKEQTIQVDETFTPISLVILVQANSRVEKILPEVTKIGNLIKPLIVGDQGEAAVIAFDSRIRTMQDFTSDSDKITAAIKKLSYGSTSSRLIDAVDEGVRMLRTRPKDRRRIMLVIGETRDFGSEGRGRETLINLQLANVLTYWLDMSHLLGTLTQSAPMPRPDNNPPAFHPLPPNVAATPTTVMQTYGTEGNSAEFMPLMVEIFKDVKNVFKTSPANLFTKGTGGNQFSFYRQHGLEDAISQIGEELHSQYIISYNPNNKSEGGFHEISVQVVGRDYRAQTRPGYWLAAKQ
jgi:VWFA-related protein